MELYNLINNLYILKRSIKKFVKKNNISIIIEYEEIEKEHHETLSKDVLNTLKIEKEYNEECFICLNKDDCDMIKLQCDHIFHYECAYKWLCKENNSCPICRSKQR